MGKGRLVALVMPEDFEIERHVATEKSLTKAIGPRDDPPSYMMRVIRQIETAIDARAADDRRSRAAELRRWGYQTVEYEIVR